MNDDMDGRRPFADDEGFLLDRNGQRIHECDACVRDYLRVPPVEFDEMNRARKEAGQTWSEYLADVITSLTFHLELQQSHGLEGMEP